MGNHLRAKRKEASLPGPPEGVSSKKDTRKKLTEGRELPDGAETPFSSGGERQTSGRSSKSRGGC